MLVAHLSDLHYPAGIRHLEGKRWLGAFNLLMNPLRKFDPALWPSLLEFMSGVGVDHVVVTGDIGSLALVEEYEGVRLALEEAGFEPSRITLLPGNHDAYTPRAFRNENFWKGLGPYARVEGPHDYPLVTELEGVVIIGLSSALPTPCAMSYGRIGDGQLDALDSLLAKYEGMTRIVALHHSPLHGVACDGLEDGAKLIEVLRKRGAELLLHGHIHRTEIHHIDMGPGRRPLPVMSVSPTMLRTRMPGHDPTVRFLYFNDGDMEHWLVKWDSRFRQWRPER